MKDPEAWNAHIAYLEDEVKKMEASANRLEAIIHDMEDSQKKRELRELAGRLRDEARDRRKYLALIKPA